MGILKKIAAKSKRRHQHQRQQLSRRSKAVASAVASMKDDKSYTLRTKSGQSLTLTGEQWKQLEQERSSQQSSLPQG